MEEENKKTYLNEVKVDYIKSFIDSELDKIGVFDKLKKYIDDEHEDTEEGLVRRIREAGVVDEIIDNMKNWGIDKPAKEEKGQRMIYLKLFSGKGFIDYVNVEDDSYFQFDILFLGQRFQSKKIPCNPEFTIEQVEIKLKVGFLDGPQPSEDRSKRGLRNIKETLLSNPHRTNFDSRRKQISHCNEEYW